MRIPPDEFRHAGEHLAVDQQVNIDHVFCSAGADTRARLYVKRTRDAVLAYCHNCGGHGIVGLRKSTVKSIEDLLIENEAVAQQGLGELVMPDDVIRNPEGWPNEAKAWLYQYGITNSEIIDNEIGYSESWNRVILPVYSGGKLMYWQGRAVRPGQDPKYISAKAHNKVMFTAHGAGVGVTCGDKVFIVEDILSAIKMSRHCDAIALLGTSPDIDDLTVRLENYKKVGIALDPDQAGYTKAIELEKRLSLVFLGTVRRYMPANQLKEMDNRSLEAMSIGL